MPKVYTYNAEFNPISFADRIAPMRLYKEEYDKQQAAYEKMLEETDDLGVLKDIAMDADSYGVYKSFQDEINSIADEMATKGLSTDIRNRLLKLKRRQISDINPLLERQKKRGELAKEQRVYKQSHPEAFFDNDYSITPLSQISESSTYRPYDVSDIRKNITKSIYNGLISNNGADVVNYDEIRKNYNYDNLNSNQKAIIDNTINIAKRDAASAYNQYNEQIRLKKLQYTRSRNNSGTTRGNKPSSSWGTMPDGVSIKIERDASGSERIKSKDGNVREINPVYTEDMTDEQKNEAYNKAVYKAYYNGYNYDGDLNIPGAKVTVLSDDDNNKYIYNKKKELVPITNDSLQGITELYRGTSASWLNPNGSYKYRATSGHTEKDKQKSNLGDSIQIKNYNDDIPNVVLNEVYRLLNAESGKEQETLKQAIADGARIIYAPYSNNKGNIVGYEITIRPPERKRKQQPEQAKQTQQTVQSQSNSNTQPDNSEQKTVSIEDEDSN